MQIAKDCVVRFHYRVAEEGGAAIDTSHGGEPLAVLCGRGAIIPGLEAALIGRGAGEHFEISVAPEDAYGPHRPGQIQRVPKKHFADAARLRPGVQTVLVTSQGRRPVTVHKVGMSVVDIDLNHPLAGKTLRFEVEVVDVRAASAEELAHGHVHGRGGHAH